MTPHGKANHVVVHFSCTPHFGASVRRRTPVEWQPYDNFVATGKLNRDRRSEWVAASQLRQRFCLDERTSAPRCASCTQGQLTVLRGGLVPCREHRISGGRCQGERREIYFLETSGEKIFLRSGASASRCGALTSLASRSHSASAKPSASPTSTFRARPRLPTKRSWSCSTNCGRASAPWVEGEPRECDGSAWDRLPPFVRARHV